MLSDRYGRKKGRWLTTHWLLPEVYVSFHVTSKRQRSTFLSSSKNRRQEICFTALVTTCSDQIGQNLEERKWWGPIIRILFPLNLVMLNFELSKNYDSSQEKKKRKIYIICIVKFQIPHFHLKYFPFPLPLMSHLPT